MLILLRGEFIALFILSILYLTLFTKINLKNITIIIFLTIIVISPYLIRNIILVDKIIITQSIGYNLWKGNNSEADVEGRNYSDINIMEQINKIP